MTIYLNDGFLYCYDGGGVIIELKPYFFSMVK